MTSFMEVKPAKPSGIILSLSQDVSGTQLGEIKSINSINSIKQGHHNLAVNKLQPLSGKTNVEQMCRKFIIIGTEKLKWSIWRY